MKIVRTLILILGIFIILFCIFGYIDYNGQKMELGAKQAKNIPSSINTEGDTITLSAVSEKYDKTQFGFFVIQNNSTHTLTIPYENTADHLKDGKWYEVVLNGLEFPDKTITLKPGKSFKQDIATPNYKVGKYRFVQHFKDENGKEYVLAAPFEIVWPSLKNVLGQFD